MSATEGKPTFERGTCKVCKDWQKMRGSCFGCKKKIPQYENMNGAAFSSVVPDHFHFKKVGGVDGLQVVSSHLCRECYLTEYNGFYKGNEDAKQLKLEDLPRVISYT